MTKINDMTDEEKLEKKREYHREYMKNRRATDEVFANKERALNKAHKKICMKLIQNLKKNPVKMVNIRQNMCNYSNK